MTTTFQNIGLSEARANLLENIGFEKPTEIQTKAIPAILEGRDVVGLSQTGTGKTAAYSLPFLEKIDLQDKAVQGLILTPTRELAMQVTQALKQFAVDRRLWVLTVCGGQSMERQIRSLQKGVHIVVGTPGRVIDLLERGKLSFEDLRWAVLDEADEMLSMGFIDDVKRILRQSPASRQTACFSATMPPAIRDLVANFLEEPINITIKQPQVTPDRIKQEAYMIPRGWSKTKALLPILEMANPESAIIFVRTKRTASELTNELLEAGQSADEYHGDLSQAQREKLVRRFKDGRIKMIVATDIAARGLDVANLSHVVNFDLPDNTESYIHRIGRTGRAGKTGTAIALVEPSDRRLLRQIERRVKQSLTTCKIPSRPEVEANRINRLETQVREALAGERMASFLPIVKRLGDEYDPQAIAAAVLQMTYDQHTPDWMTEDWDVPEVGKGGLPKPVKGGGGRRGGGGYRGKGGYKGKGGGGGYRGDRRGGRRSYSSNRG
ncbi:DEAD/DEAH box helicase domain protein [[Leptolyngbya] sp. PCC 7376]|uniref:DEAD/DEAH box helicase n=1 Tax=[Leptolyngbya] sp. PCC 7376 TaxID=111781 RepID=UPI00029F14F3|nr:DEAD/DEAH box helicase [[Leptolyngbya] sp. PCC 7376]AFY39592.1 DEAD/DEAH box helicase domain protein [[Leptolyngbya] sp. PCC 7376]